MSAFEKWWADYDGGESFVLEIARDAWNAATLAERERCARLCENEGWEPGHMREGCHELRMRERGRRIAKGETEVTLLAKEVWLAPCPFCGSAATLANPCGEWFVTCTRVGVCYAANDPEQRGRDGRRIHGFTLRDDAVKAWNTRYSTTGSLKLYAETLIEPAGDEWQVKLRVGEQSFNIGLPQETLDEAERYASWLIGALRNAGARVAP